MNYIMLDTCVLLDISSNKNELPFVSALEMLTSEGKAVLLISKLVLLEYARNKDRIATKTAKRLSQEFKQVKNVVSEFAAPEIRQQTIDVLNDINHKLPLLSEANYSTINRVEKLIAISHKIPLSDAVKIAAAHRGLDKKAPFHISKNSVADAIIIEQFSEFIIENQSTENTFMFITHNHNDFSGEDHRIPHPDFSEIFNSDNIFYFNNLTPAINQIDSELLAEVEYEHDYTEETRGLQEILTAMDELVDKIWYNRHQNRLYEIEMGKIEIIPKGTARYGNDVIHEHILQGAIQSAKRVEEQYEDLGPLSDFEWGMINGKLSALRWILGEQWDELYT